MELPLIPSFIALYALTFFLLVWIIGKAGK